QQLGATPDRIDRLDLRSDRRVLPVRERAPLPGSRLDQHVVAEPDELAGPRGGQRDAVLVGLDLLDDSDLHGRADSSVWRASRPAAKAAAKKVGSSSGPRPMWESGRPAHASCQPSPSSPTATSP